MKVLLLSVGFEPLRVITPRKAFDLVFDEKAEVLEESDEVWRSPSRAFPVPKVVRLKHFVKIPYRARIPLKREAVLARDEGRCAYCSGKATTIDHVQPRSRGGKHRWENVVAACSPCNAKKDDRTLAELGWRLPFKPFAPSGTRWLIIGISEPDPVWVPYLGSSVVPA